MGEINKAKKTVTAQKTTSTPTTQTTTTVTAAPAAPPAAPPAQPPATAQQSGPIGPPAPIPTLSQFWHQGNQGNVDASLKNMNMALGNSVKANNTNDFIHTDLNSPEKNTHNSAVNLSSSVSKILNTLNQRGVPPEDALTQIKEIFNNPSQRKLILGEKSIFNAPQYLNGMANVGIGGGETYDSDAIKNIAGLYGNIKRQYDTRHGIKRGQPVLNTQPGGDEEVENIKETIKNVGDKIKVKKTP